MDSSNPFSSSQTFTNLLFSQEDIPNSQSFENPLSPENQPPSSLGREGRVRWTLPKEETLASPWLNTSKDSIVGNEQRAGAFWKRVAAYYAASPAVSNLPIRESKTCKQKWTKLSKDVMKFAGCYDYASRSYKFGKGENDVLTTAYNLYFQDQKAKFTNEHVWRIVKNEQKWCNFTTCKSKPAKKKAKLCDASSSNTTSHVEEETMERPISVKAAKAKARNKGKSQAAEGDHVEELQSLWAIKEKDNIFKEKDNMFKERLSKNKFLNSLIARSDSLSDMEVTLKKKLINEMLGGYNEVV